MSDPAREEPEVVTTHERLDAADADRREFGDLVASLDDIQWRTPSLCDGWSVEDVVAHVVSYDELSVGDVVRRVVASRGSLTRTNAAVMAAASRDHAALVARLRTPIDRDGFGTSVGGVPALLDAMIHQQDVRRPLGLPRSIPTDRLRDALRSVVWAPPVRGVWHGRGVRLVATDLDWSFGVGPEARGTGEAVLMTLAGRRGVAHELTGPGAARLRARFG